MRLLVWAMKDQIRPDKKIVECKKAEASLIWKKNFD